MKRLLTLLAFMTLLSTTLPAQSLVLKKKRYKYDEVDFENIVRRYFGKETTDRVEGIYSVSCLITRTRRGIFSSREKTKVVRRRDNYARVAIIKDWPGTKRDFIEISMSSHDAKKFPIVGEMNTLAEGTGLIYNHIQPDGSLITFSMFPESAELLEGTFSKAWRRTRVTYKLSYLKIYPKTEVMTTRTNPD